MPRTIVSVQCPTAFEETARVGIRGRGRFSKGVRFPRRKTCFCIGALKNHGRLNDPSMNSFRAGQEDVERASLDIAGGKQGFEVLV
jgi:hypothetical protein